MNKNEAEKVLRNTIEYASNEIKKEKKKRMISYAVFAGIILVIALYVFFPRKLIKGDVQNAHMIITPANSLSYSIDLDDEYVADLLRDVKYVPDFNSNKALVIGNGIIELMFQDIYAKSASLAYIHYDENEFFLSFLDGKFYKLTNAEALKDYMDAQYEREIHNVIVHKEISYLNSWKIDKDDQKSYNFHGDKNIFFAYGMDGYTMGNKFFDRYVGPANYKEGCLYIKDVKNDKLYQLTDVQVDDFKTTEDNLHLFVFNRQILLLSKDFTRCNVIYTTNNDINFNVADKEQKMGYLYFVDGDKMIKLNLSDYSYEVLADKCYGERFIVKQDIAIYCSICSEHQTGGVEYIINIRDGYTRAVINSDEYKLFDYDDSFFGQETEYTYQKSPELIGAEK